MRRLLSSKSPLVAGAIPFLIWVAGAHVFVGYVLAPLLPLLRRRPVGRAARCIPGWWASFLPCPNGTRGKKQNG